MGKEDINGRRELDRRNPLSRVTISFPPEAIAFSDSAFFKDCLVVVKICTGGVHNVDAP